MANSVETVENPKTRDMEIAKIPHMGLFESLVSNTHFVHTVRKTS